MKATVLDINNKSVGDVELFDEIFAAESRLPLIYDVVKMQLANRRSGTAATRNRALMEGSTAKIYRQKGTGRARHGDSRANIFVGGGKAFGPHPKSYEYTIPKKAKRGGLRSALSIKTRENKLIVLDSFTLDAIKTKDALARLAAIGVKNGLIVIEGRNENLEKSVKNINGIKLVRAEGLNVYDIMKYEHTVILKDALMRIQEVLKP